MRRNRARTAEEHEHYLAGGSDILTALFASPQVISIPELRYWLLSLAIQLGFAMDVREPEEDGEWVDLGDELGTVPL